GCRPFWQQPEHREGSQRLARTRLPDQAEALPVLDGERDAIDHARAVDLDDQVLHLEAHATTSGTCTCAPWRDRVGSVASRSASPSRFRPSTVSVIARPGQTTVSGCTPMYRCRSASSVPQDASVSEPPKPK